MTKIKKPGMLLILSLILGIYLAVTGMGFWVILIAAITGFLSELVLKSGNYQSSSKLIFGAWVFLYVYLGTSCRCSSIPAIIPICQEVIRRNTLKCSWESSPCGSAPIYLVACFVFGIIGGFTGKAILKKHFVKAGIA